MNRVILTGFALLLSMTFAINVQAQNRIRIKGIEPGEIYPGSTFEITGVDFGASQPNNIAVMISATVVDRSYRHKLRVLKWSDRRIRVDTSDTVVPARYSVGIYWGDETGLVSNLASLVVLGGMVIERISPDTAQPGDTFEIQGRHFGRHQANRVLSINRFGRKTRMTVLEWSDSLIRAQVPARLDPGPYVVIIYYDSSYLSSSDSVRMTIERSR